MLWLILGVVAGLLLGSFLTGVVFRFHDEWAWMKSRKGCLVCEVPRAWYDMIPIVGDVLMRGRCRNCKSFVAWQYVLIEVIALVLVVFHFWRYSFGIFVPEGFEVLTWIWLMRDILFTGILIIIFVYDLKYLLVFRWSVAVGVVLGLWFNLILGVSGISLLFGMWVLFLFFYAQFLISSGRAVGSGDMLIGLVIGAMLGLINGVLAVMIGYVIGALVGGVMTFRSAAVRAGGVVSDRLDKGRNDELGRVVAFGPYLAVGAFIMLVWGEFFIGLI